MKLRRHRHRRRPCRLRSSGGVGALWRPHPAAHPHARDLGRDVLQSRHRRGGQGPSGARDRCPGRADGPGRGCGGNPVSPAQPPQGPGGARAARPSRPSALPRSNAIHAAQHFQSGNSCRERGRPDFKGRNRHRRFDRGWRRDCLRQSRAHHRHLPQRPDPYRRDQNSRRPDEDRRRRGSAQHRPVQDALWLWPADGPAEDRHAAAAGWAHHRLGQPGDAAGR